MDSTTLTPEPTYPSARGLRRWGMLSSKEQCAVDPTRAMAEAKTSRERSDVASIIKTIADAKRPAPVPTFAPRVRRLLCPNPRECGDPGCDGRCGYEVWR